MLHLDLSTFPSRLRLQNADANSTVSLRYHRAWILSSSKFEVSTFYSHHLHSLEFTMYFYSPHTSLSKHLLLFFSSGLTFAEPPFTPTDECTDAGALGSIAIPIKTKQQKKSDKADFQKCIRKSGRGKKAKDGAETSTRERELVSIESPDETRRKRKEGGLSLAGPTFAISERISPRT